MGNSLKSNNYVEGRNCQNWLNESSFAGEACDHT